MTDYTLITYITNNYITLLLLSALVFLLFANRKMKIDGLKYIWAIMGIVFTLTLCEAVEDMCVVYQWDGKIEYIKTAMVYLLYPLVGMIEVYLVAPIRHKALTAIPYIINCVLVLSDLLFDTHIVFYFFNSYVYQGGFMYALPIVVLLFYVIMLGVYSVIYLSKRSVSKGLIVGFMTVSSVITAIGEKAGYAERLTETVAVVEILVYYFFLAAISYSETQKKLYESRLELEQDKIRLMTAQIQPHFIFNSLSTLQSLCYTDGEAAADLIIVFGNYLRANIDSLSSDKPIPFHTELEHIKQFIKIVKAGTNIDFDVIYELKTTGFSVPPLTVQPIVENAIKHGALTRSDGTGRVTVKTEDTGDTITITITDNGTGADLTDKQKEHYSVGIKNTKKRLALQCGGTLKVDLTPEGSMAVITIPTVPKKAEVSV